MLSFCCHAHRVVRCEPQTPSLDAFIHAAHTEKKNIMESLLGGILFSLFKVHPEVQGELRSRFEFRRSDPLRDQHFLRALPEGTSMDFPHSGGVASQHLHLILVSFSSQGKCCQGCSLNVTFTDEILL